LTTAETALAVLQDDADAQAHWQQVRRYVRVTMTGLVPVSDEPMPVELYGTLCGVIGAGRKALRWAVGDALLYGEVHYGEDYAQYVDLLGCSENTLRQYRRVAARIPYEERDNEVNWTAYQITAHLDQEVRDELLGQYTSGAIEDTTELRDEVRSLSGDAPDDELLPACPQCGGKLTSRRCKGCGLDFPAACRWIHKLLGGESDDE